MKNQPILKWLISLIGILSLIAASAGLLYQLPANPIRTPTIAANRS